MWDDDDNQLVGDDFYHLEATDGPSQTQELMDGGFVGVRRRVNVEDVAPSVADQHGGTSLLQIEGSKIRPEAVTITLGGAFLAVTDGNGEAQPGLPYSGIADVFARITWGAGGVTTSVDVDILNGTVIRVAGSFINVTAHVVGDALVEPPAICSAFASYLPSTGGRPCQRTINLGAIAGGASSAVLPVPPYAGQLRLLTTSLPGNTDSHIDFFRDPAGALPIALWRVANAAGRNTGDLALPCVIPGAARFWQWTTIGAFADANVTVTFLLWT